jgi:hypothetical protein
MLGGSMTAEKMTGPQEHDFYAQPENQGPKVLLGDVAPS